MIHHITRATQQLIFWGLIGIALVLTAVRLTLSVIDIYQEDLETIISREVAAPVKIGHLGAGMRGFRPELRLKEVQVLNNHLPTSAPIVIREIRLSMDLLKSYGQQQMLASSWITLVGAQLTVIRHTDGSIGVQGLPASNTEPPLWLLQTALFEVLHSQISWQDETRHPIPTQAKPAASQTLSPPEQLIFKQVNLSLKNDQNGYRHLLNLLVRLPKSYGESLSISMQLRGNFLAPQGINGLMYLESKGLQFANLIKGDWPLNLTVGTGQSDIQLWSYWQKSQLQAITGVTDVQNAVLHRPKQSPLTIKQLMSRFNWVQQNDTWQLLVDNLSLTANTLQLTDTRLLLAGNTQPHSTLQRLAVQLPHLDLHQAAQAGQFFGAALPYPADNIQGELNNFALQLTQETRQFAVQGTFKNIALQAYQNLPGISHLSGAIQGNQQQGQLDLAVQDTTLALPHIFAKALPLQALQTRFSWQQDEQDWIIASPSITVSVPDLQANSRLSFKINRQTHAVWMDLQAGFSGSSSIKAFGRYWPTGLMGKAAADWLNQAFIKGQINPRGLLLSGALTDFPFTQQQGVFELILDFKGIDLQYATDWQPVQAIDAEVLFHNDSLHINAQQASVEGAQLTQFDIDLPSFASSPAVTVQIKGQPKLQQTLSYLQKSPVKESVNRLLEVIDPQGLAPLDLLIQVPLVDNKPLKLQGNLQLQDVKLSVLPLSLPVDHVQGALHFNADGLEQGQLQANALGDAIQVNLHNTPAQMQLAVTGHTDIIDLQQQFNTSTWRYLRGDSDYSLNLLIPNDQRPTTLSLSSDLIGITLRLPDILAKRPSEKRRLNLQMTLGDQPRFPITMQLGTQLKAAALLDAKSRQLTAAEIRIGNDELTGLPTSGAELTLNLLQCNLLDWLALTENNAPESQPPTEPFLNHVKLNAQQLVWQGLSLGKLALSMHHTGQAWQTEFDSPFLKGQLQNPTITANDPPALIDLDYVNLSALAHLKAAPPAPQPTGQRLPLFNLTAKQVLWEGINMGELNIATTRIANGLIFKQFDLKNAQGGLNLTGDWIANGTNQETTLTGNLNLRHFGDFLSTLHITQDLKNTVLDAKIAVNWPGAPQHFALEHLQGRLEIELSNGRILSIEPGFGRLLGFLAFEQWGRRLRLDFSDMLSKGLTFNKIHGHFDLSQGKAFTNDLVVDAIPALVNIKGSAHLAERTLDYRAKVLPKSSAAVPIAGTIVDRAVTYALEAVTGNSQAGFLLGSEYKILGSWQNPQVIRLRENDGLLQKTWYGLTDFSWLRKNINNN